MLGQTKHASPESGGQPLPPEWRKTGWPMGVGRKNKIDLLGDGRYRPGRSWRSPSNSRADGDLVADDRLAVADRQTRRRILSSGKPSWNGATWQAGRCPEKWAGLIGEYGEDFNILQILERDGQLYALIEWFFFYPLTQESDTVFKFPAFGLYHDEKIVFARDANGRATKAVAAEVPFKRRTISGEGGGTFQIKPIRQMDGLRKEALAAEPPKEAGDFRKPELVDLTTLDKTIKLDIRYATDNNFLGTLFYTSPGVHAKPAAERGASPQKARGGVRPVIHDVPAVVRDKMFWEATPKRSSVRRQPSKGSRCNRGCIDLTL